MNPTHSKKKTRKMTLMASYGMVWYGIVWYGMAWRGMVWYGMVWYGSEACYDGKSGAPLLF